MQSKMKDIPQSEQDKLFALMEKNPDLLMKIASEAQEKIKSGMGQTEAMMEVARKYETELRQVIS